MLPPPPRPTLFPYTTLFRSPPHPRSIPRMTLADLLASDVPVACVVQGGDRKSTRLNSSHVSISYAVFCLKKKIKWTVLVELRYFFLWFAMVPMYARFPVLFW